MKYAFIVLIALYLIIYGCSPDNSEKATDSHEKSAPASQQQVPEGRIMVAVPEDQGKHDEIANQENVGEAGQVPAEQVQSPKEEQQPAAVAEIPQQVVMPCGRIVDQADIPLNAPCFNQQPETAQAPADKSKDLAAAMQKMVKTTNDMVLVTRQLVAATQEMLNAGKGVAEEVIDTGNAIMEAQQEKLPVDGQGTQATAENNVLQSMQDVISAAREVIKTADKALSTSLEEKGQ